MSEKDGKRGGSGGGGGRGRGGEGGKSDVMAVTKWWLFLCNLVHKRIKSSISRK